MNTLVLENRHTGERLELWRVVKNGQTHVGLRGQLGARGQGPPLHVHYKAAEEVRVVAGTMSAIVDGRQIQVRAGETATFPAGSAHRWWNGGDDTLVAVGYGTPAIDLDRYLHGAFDVINSGPSDRPPLFHMAHLVWRHRRTQAVLFAPRPVQAILLPLIVLVGTILGRYRGTDWPGSPERCTEAPLVANDGV